MGRTIDDAPHVTLLWMEDCPEWAAAGNHLRGTIARLVTSGVGITKVIAETQARPGASAGLASKLRRLSSLVLRGVFSARRGTLLARWSPFTWPALWVWQRRGGTVVLLVQGNLADMYSSNPWTRKVPFITAMAEKSLHQADAVAVSSAGLAQWVHEITGRPVGSIPVILNGVNLTTFAESPHQTDAAPYALFVGNFAAWQGLDTIMEAFDHPNWPAGLGLRFIGDGADRDLIDRPDVTWLGVQPRSVVAHELAGATVSLATRKLVDASATGVTPFKVIESAAAGVPYVATRVPGQTELATALGGGILIEPNDPAALAAAVARIFSSPKLCAELGAAGRAGAQVFAWEARGAQLRSVIESVGAPRPQATPVRA